MNEVSVNEAFRPIIFRWFILGGALLSLVAGNFDWWILPPVLSQYFIQAVIVLTAALCLNLIWFVVLFSHGQLVVDRFGRIITYSGLVVDFFLAGLVFWLLGQTYPETWWLFFWPVLMAAGLNRLGAGVFWAVTILPLVYLKLTVPTFFFTTHVGFC